MVERPFRGFAIRTVRIDEWSALGDVGRGVSIVDTRRLQAIFGPLLVASKQRLAEELERNHEFMARMYGEENVQAFADIRDVDAQ